MKIKVFISTWQVPFDQTVIAVEEFTDPNAAKEFINQRSKQWWDENEGNKDRDAEPYQPIEEVGYNHARYELWGGETGFHAMLDDESYQELLKQHYAREGFVPGYMQNALAYKSGDPEQIREMEQKTQEVFDYYSKPKH